MRQRSLWHCIFVLSCLCVSLVWLPQRSAHAQSLVPSLVPSSQGFTSADLLASPMRGLLLEGGLQLNQSSSSQYASSQLGTLRQPMTVLPVLFIGVPIAGVALLTSLVGSMFALLMKRGLLAWGIVSLICGTGGIVFGLAILTFLPLSIPFLLASTAVLALGIVDIVLHAKLKHRRRWRRMYGSKQQQIKDAILAELATPGPAVSGTLAPSGMTLRF